MELARNEGFGAGINAGVDRARELGCARVLALNPDATIDPDSVRILLDASRSDPRALLGPRIVRSDGTTWFSGAVLDPRERHHAPCAPRRARRRPDVADRGLLPRDDRDVGRGRGVRRRLLHVLGGPRPVVALARGRRLGCCSARTRPPCTMRAAPSRAPGKSSLYVYFNCRNRLLFARKRFSSRHGRLWWRGSVAYAWRVATRGSRRMLARHPLLLWSALRGTLAGAVGPLAPRHGSALMSAGISFRRPPSERTETQFVTSARNV